jgi:hypothetical protein
MAKSKMIARRTQKKATILASMQTVKDAIRRAQLLGETWMAADHNDPRVDEIQRIVDHLVSVLKRTPQQMRADGVSSIEDYFDDARSPQVAQTIKREVNQIAKWHDEQRGQSAQPATPQEQQQPVGYVPDHAVVSSEEKDMADKQANGGGGFSTDRDEQGEAKAPVRAEVPRLAKKKKKEAEDPAPVAPVGAPPTDQVPEAPVAAPAAPAAAPAPAPAGNGSVNPIEYIPTETLIKVIGDLPKEDDFAQNKNKQDALIALTDILKSRPVLPPEPVEGQAAAPAAPAPAMPVAASKKKADLGDHAVGGNGSIGDAPSSSPAVSVGAGNNISTDGANPAPAKADTSIDLGGLSIASSLEEDKTADDYRIHDYKLQDEGFVPSGRLPDMDEQEQHMHPEGEFEKESVAPPHSENVTHALKEESDVDNPFAVAWSMHNKGDKMSAVKAAIAAVHSILGAGNGSGAWSTDIGEKGKIVEDGGRTPEVAQAHAALDESPARLDRPATTKPIQLNKQAAEMTTSKAVKQAETLGNDLKKMYLDAKSLTQVNDTRVVREAVESIFRAADLMDGALKALGKQHEQEENEAAAQEIKAKNKKSSSIQGLSLAAAE